MTTVEVTGEAVPRFSRREMAEYTRRVLLALEKIDRLPEQITEVSIALVDDTAMISLNRRFRRKGKTTDVLTFPADDSYNDPSQKGSRPLGDIVISVDQARRQAADEKHSLATEVRYLILHGVLHALGYDHETDKGEMNALEVQVREVVGLS
ncbi:MAG TPA: rRNA maturation RNase YbeY [Thermoanaerobaculia bacterium]|nr:rRNA maturation RNase YbeY [Thermoanaerobaculia bacterium]